MKGFYSREKRNQFEERLRKEQEQFEADLLIARAGKKRITVETNHIREYNKVLEAQRRLQELQKLEKERLKIKDNRDRYVQFLRNHHGKREGSKERNISALDLNVKVATKIPKPSAAKETKGNLEENLSRIPKIAKEKGEENLPWKKGDLLDSLDLGSTNMKKMFKNRPKLCESPGAKAEEKAEWLKENIRESINEWAPKKIEKLPEIKPTKRVVNLKAHKAQLVKPEENKEKTCLEVKKNEIIEENLKIEEVDGKINKRYQAVFEEPLVSPEFPVKPVEVVKKKPSRSKFVNKIRKIPESDLDFLQIELNCVDEEEAKLKASLARLDLKSIKAKNQIHTAELAELEKQAQDLEESLKKVGIRKNSPAESEISTHPSVIPDNISIFSAYPYPKPRQLPDARSVCTEIPDKPSGYAYKNERKRSKPSEIPKEPHRIGAIYNEISARSGRYNAKNPAPEYALPKVNSKEMISFRKVPEVPDYTLDVVKIHPNVDIKNWYKEMPKWD